MSGSDERRFTSARILGSLGIAMSSLLWSAPAIAQEGSLSAAESTIPGGTLMVLAYMLLWVMFGGYLFFIMRRQRKLQDELEGLEHRIDEVLGTVGGDEA